MIRDEGPGFPAEAADRVFEPFYTTKEKGMGIGLYLAEADHRGPRRNDRGPQPARAKGPNSGSTSQERDMNEPLILVVEDDPVQRKLLRENLESRGYPVIEAASRKEALEAVLRHPVDVAVVDYKLGDDTGTAAIRDMLAANPLVTPIMVTAYGNIERAVEAVRSGAYDYIVKPLDFEKFLLVLERADGAAEAAQGDLAPPGAARGEVQRPELRLRLAAHGGRRPAGHEGGAERGDRAHHRARRERARTSWPG